MPVKLDHLPRLPELKAGTGADVVGPASRLWECWACPLGIVASQLAVMGPMTGPDPWLGTEADGL